MWIVYSCQHTPGGEVSFGLIDQARNVHTSADNLRAICNICQSWLAPSESLTNVSM